MKPQHDKGYQAWGGGGACPVTAEMAGGCLERATPDEPQSRAGGRQLGEELRSISLRCVTFFSAYLLQLHEVLGHLPQARCPAGRQ